MTRSPNEQALFDAFLSPIDTPAQMKDWIYTYLGIDLPIGHVDPDSNSSPIEWLFEAYTTIRKNRGSTIPSYVVYSARECYKTLSCSVLEILVMVHFQLNVAHMAAIIPQYNKAVQYVDSFITKIGPLLEGHGRSIDAKNKRNITVKEHDGRISYITIIVCTLQGANSEHVTLFVIDEVDVVRFPQAYEEAKLIPGMMGPQFPLTVMTSTRKFAFGLMQKEIDRARAQGNPILHWNIIDVTEKCQPDRHRPDLPKELRYIPERLP
ncbi:MAG: hypothetical protein ACREGB_01465, partial [Candidatus Saccharimonadales bacterium]